MRLAADPRYGSSNDASARSLVALFGFAVLAFALYVSWQKDWGEVALGTALVAAALTAILCVDFSLVRASLAGMRFEARQPKGVRGNGDGPSAGNRARVASVDEPELASSPEGLRTPRGIDVADEPELSGDPMGHSQWLSGAYTANDASRRAPSSRKRDACGRQDERFDMLARRDALPFLVSLAKAILSHDDFTIFRRVALDGRETVHIASEFRLKEKKARRRIDEIFARLGDHLAVATMSYEQLRLELAEDAPDGAEGEHA